MSGFATLGTFEMPREIFDCHNKRWTESREAVKYIVQCTGESPHHQNRIIHPDTSVC